MSTGALLIDRVCSQAKLNATASSADRALVLTFLQDAVDRVCFDAEVVNDPTQSVSLTSGTSTYTLGSAPFNISDLIAIQEITLSDASVTSVPLQQVTMREIKDLQQGAGQANSTPYVYAVSYPTITFYPTPGASTTLNVSYVADGPTVADSSTALTFIPKALQWGCLFNLAMHYALTYKKQPEAELYLQKYLTDRHVGLPAVRRWVNRVGGRVRAESLEGGVLLTSPSQDTGLGF